MGALAICRNATLHITMMVSTALFLLSALSLLPIYTARVPKFEVNLDVAPEKRWREVTKYYMETGLLQSNMEAKKHGYIAIMPREKEEKWYPIFKKGIPEYMLREMEGIVATINELEPENDMNITVRSIILGQGKYEANYPVFCSGLLAAMTNGTTVHARNMDYPLQFPHKGKMIGYPELTIQVDFMRSGKLLYSSTHWPLQLGLHTAMRYDGWSFQQNTRRTGDDVALNMEAGKSGGLQFSPFVRTLMETTPDYETAVEILKNANFMSTHYFILAGAKPYEGAVLTIDRNSQHMRRTPKPATLSEKQWSLYQPNDDRGKLASYLNPSDPRRAFAELRLKVEKRSSVSPNWAVKLIRTPPLKNPFTVFTTVMVPATNYFKIVLPEESAVGFPDVQQRSFLHRDSV